VVQGHVASDHGWLVILSIPGRSGEDEPGVEAIGSCVHKRRALNTRLSSGTSAGTFACPVGPYRNCRGETGTKNEPKWYFVPIQKKGWKIDPHVSNLESRWCLFRGVQVHPHVFNASTFLRVDQNPRISKICVSWMSVWNILANYVLVPLKFNLNWNIWKPFLKSSPFDFSGQRLSNTSLAVFFRFHSFSLVVKWPEFARA